MGLSFSFKASRFICVFIMIHIRNLSKSYGKKSILQQIELARFGVQGSGV